MASVEKYTQSAVYAMLKHNERTAHSHSNKEIDITKSYQNLRLSEERACTDYDYFKQHLESYKCMNRADVIKMATWIITAPDDLPQEQEYAFFSCCREFLNLRYGANNELQCIVHYDERHSFLDPKTGQIKESRPHMHYSFVPAIVDKKGDVRICAKKVLTQCELRNFHPDLQKHLNKNCIPGTIYSGVTKQQGGNVSVKELKKSSNSISYNYSKERSFDF